MSIQKTNKMLSLADFALSATAIEGFRQREYFRLRKQRLEVVNGMGPAATRVLLWLGSVGRGLKLMGHRYGLPDDPPEHKRANCGTARRLHNAGFARIVPCSDGTWLEITPLGRAKVALIRERRS